MKLEGNTTYWDTTGMFQDIGKEEEAEAGTTWLSRSSVNDKWLKYSLFIFPRAIPWEHRGNRESTAKPNATEYDEGEVACRWEN